MEWISVKKQWPSNEKKDGEHIHCWCAINGRFVEHLAWNPYYLCFDDADEDDVSGHNDNVTHWQLLVIPEAPKEGE